MPAQRILVTGAAGFVGSFVAARLAAMGHQVVGCDNFNDYYDPRLKHDRVRALLAPAGVVCHTVELSDAAQVAALFERERPQLVVHLAAQAGVRYSIDNPSVYIQSNLVGFGNILEACRQGAIEHLLYASSSSVYGNNAKVPFSEDDQVDAPVSLYAATKKSNELMAHSYSHLFKLPATGLRFFTVYGPWGRPDMAYFSFAEKMMRGATIPVFAEGLLTRDFTYIDDIVEGVVRLLFKPTPATATSAPHTVFNIGNHNPVQVLEFIRTLESVMGVEARKEFLPMQPGDVPATHASIAKLKAWVDFAPTTPLATGLANFWTWYRDWAPTRA
ncbi:NAD-dependent epimerase/dehydratase family protein [Massilia aurea]|jgi:UDP-glucuronate 4-epimerase|uniref:NAD-dependent epimerase/dehydratase family protein n=1 Tax=Massilia aurea TaxID=373040 RepID=UPI0021636DDE|nr:NAD-dependent epimerase/dehydratase family protein [Massilia aurea]MCS0708713.1 NAD-dependent epimerase/dehydratase family protein [Massilia aurea]